MISFKQYLTESISIEDINKRIGEQKVILFMGRLQPPTKFHIETIRNIYKKYKLPIIITLVKGKKTDSKKNPFPLSIQEKILKECLKDIKYEIKIIPTGFIGNVIHLLRNENKEPIMLFCGSDRVKGYEKQIEKYKNEIKWNIKVIEIKRDLQNSISATKVRKSLKENDLNKFKENMARCSWKFYEELKRFVK